MKDQHPFLALVKFELFRLWHSCGTPGHLMWVLGFVWGLLPAVLLMGRGWSQNADLDAALPGLIGLWSIGWLFGWLFLLGFHFAFALTRDIRSAFPLMTMPDGNSDEFFGTRAINLRCWFRAKTLTLALVMAAPLLLNLAASFHSSTDVVFVGEQASGLMGDTRDARSPLPLESHGLVEWFGGYPQFDNHGSPVGGTQYALWAQIRHGPIVFAVWLIWVAVAALALVQVYYGLISQLLVKRSRRLASCAVALLPVGSLVAVPLFAGNETHLFQTAFIYFAEFWIHFVLALGLFAFLAQRFCEQRFAEQEVL